MFDELENLSRWLFRHRNKKLITSLIQFSENSAVHSKFLTDLGVGEACRPHQFTIVQIFELQQYLRELDPKNYLKFFGKCCA